MRRIWQAILVYAPLALILDLARFGQVLAAGSAATPQEFIEELLGELRAWTGPEAELQDDVTVVVVDVLPTVP